MSVGLNFSEKTLVKFNGNDIVIEQSENSTHKFSGLFLDDFVDFSINNDNTLLLTSDDTLGLISEKLDILTLKNIIFFIEDFKDGRVFSLIRQIRQVNKIAEIFIAGNYGLDQANYYLKSGATGFFIKDEQLDTLLKTLNDLKSGHFGNSVNKLPMFQ